MAACAELRRAQLQRDRDKGVQGALLYRDCQRAAIYNPSPITEHSLDRNWSVFIEGGKTGGPGEKTLEARERTDDKLKPHMIPCSGFEPGPQR